MQQQNGSLFCMQGDASSQQMLVPMQQQGDMYGGAGQINMMMNGTAQPQFMQFGPGPGGGPPTSLGLDWNAGGTGGPAQGASSAEQGYPNMLPQGGNGLGFVNPGFASPPGGWNNGNSPLTPLLQGATWDSGGMMVPGSTPPGAGVGTDSGSAAMGGMFGSGQPGNGMQQLSGQQQGNVMASDPQQQQQQQQHQQQQWLMVAQQPQQQQQQQQQQMLLGGGGGMGAMQAPNMLSGPGAPFTQGFYQDPMMIFAPGMLQVPGGPQAWPMAMPFGMPQAQPAPGAGGPMPMQYAMQATGQQFGMPPMGSVMQYGMPQGGGQPALHFPGAPHPGQPGMQLPMGQGMPGQQYNFEIPPQLPNLMLPQMAGNLQQPFMFPAPGMPGTFEASQPQPLPPAQQAPPPALAQLDTVPGVPAAAAAPAHAKQAPANPPHDKQAVDEARKMKRQQCNRESARRSLMLKNARIKGMNSEVSQMEDRNTALREQLDQLNVSADSLEHHNKLLMEGIHFVQAHGVPPPQDLQSKEAAVAHEVESTAARLEQAMRADIKAMVIKYDEEMHGGEGTEGTDEEGYSTEPEGQGGGMDADRGPSKVRHVSPPPAVQDTPAAGAPGAEPAGAAGAQAHPPQPAAPVASAAPAAPAMGGPAAAGAGANPAAAAQHAPQQHPLFAAAAAAAAGGSTKRTVFEKTLAVDAACWQKAASAFASSLALMAQAVQQRAKVGAGDLVPGVVGQDAQAVSSASGPSSSSGTFPSGFKSDFASFGAGAAQPSASQATSEEGGARSAAAQLLPHTQGSLVAQAQMDALVGFQAEGRNEHGMHGLGQLGQHAMLEAPARGAVMAGGRLDFTQAVAQVSGMSVGALTAGAAAGMEVGAGLVQAAQRQARASIGSAGPTFALVQALSTPGGAVFVVNHVGGGDTPVGAGVEVQPVGPGGSAEQQQQQQQLLGSPMTSHLLHVERGRREPGMGAEEGAVSPGGQSPDFGDRQGTMLAGGQHLLKNRHGGDSHADVAVGMTGKDLDEGQAVDAQEEGFMQ